MGYVYLLLEVDKDGNERHKIGFTKNKPEKRLKQLKTGNSNIISVLDAYGTDNYVKVERWLHKRYSCQRTEANNEWFILSNDQVMEFQQVCKEADDIVNFMLENNHFYD